ncbi:MAG: response regulator transcription factor [Candidatus Sulfotelmatobacter sp.]|jgi:DNA-binding response OmpR family regulator
MTSNGKILIVDDDADLRQALRLRLRANHYETVNACDGYSAIAQAYKEHPNLIILDLGLPAGNGFVVLDRLQKDDKLSTIPVIVLTARDAQSSEQMALRSGAAAFFQKPADNADLLSVIRATLSHAEGSTSLPS